MPPKPSKLDFVGGDLARYDTARRFFQGKKGHTDPMVKNLIDFDAIFEVSAVFEIERQIYARGPRAGFFWAVLVCSLCWQQLGPTCITSSASSPSAAAALPLRLFSTSGAGETDRGRIASSRQSHCRLSHRHFPANSITAPPQLPLRFSDHRLSLVQREINFLIKICAHTLLRELRI